MSPNKMTVEIWSDVTCPFCYIGKRKFENALFQFKDATNIEVVWKSFELVPGFKTEPTKNMHQFLAKFKGISLEQSIRTCDHVADMARLVGLEYNFHKAIPTNSFSAHQFSHLAKQNHLQDKAEERLFRAYFTEGKNIDDIPTLMQLGEEIGLDPIEVKNALQSNQYADEVQQDIYEGKQIGITSVPSYIFDGKTRVTGSQESNVFLETLEKVFAEWKQEKEKSNLIVTEGQSCKTNEDCK